MALGVLWLDVPLAVACLLAAVHHVWLLVVRQVPFVPAASHAVMGVGMAAMFVPALDPVPRPVWAAIFLLVGAWFGAAALRAGSLLGDAGHLAVGAVAMLFMLVRHAHGATGPDGPVDPGHADHAGAAAGVPPTPASPTSTSTPPNRSASTASTSTAGRARRPASASH
ncbi:MAG: DUF5134 domain-containing protein, partial [Gammaproteobacteria bacterium]